MTGQGVDTRADGRRHEVGRDPVKHAQIAASSARKAREMGKQKAQQPEKATNDNRQKRKAEQQQQQKEKEANARKSVRQEEEAKAREVKEESAKKEEAEKAKEEQKRKTKQQKRKPKARKAAREEEEAKAREVMDEAAKAREAEEAAKAKEAARAEEAIKREEAEQATRANKRDLRRFLSRHGLEIHFDVLWVYGVESVQDLVFVTDEDLRQAGVSKPFQRRKMLRAVENFNKGNEQDSDSDTSALVEVAKKMEAGDT